jgi:site-specific DNA-cytosine methylase
MRAIEFFSGIGAFSQAAKGRNIEVVAAFDQSQNANNTYALNYDLRPQSRNLDSISAREIPAAELWWLSPPCTPFSARGKKRDDRDPRAHSFLNLIKLIAELTPETVMVENVQGFVGSQVYLALTEVLQDCGYERQHFDICPTGFGVPMRRPRHFVVGRRNGSCRAVSLENSTTQRLVDFIDSVYDPQLKLEDELFERYKKGFDIVDAADPGACLTCFTSGYWRCMKASGSLLSLPDGGARRVSPAEGLRLLGFAPDFIFPAELDLATRWRLIGNSVDVRSIRFLLDAAGHIERKSGLV